MSAVSVTCRRTLSRARSSLSSVLAVVCFLAAAGVVFAFRLEEAEGTARSLVAVWASAVAPLLPLLAAFLAMDVWSDERRTGRLDLLLSIAVRERDYTLGKALGVWIAVVVVTLLSIVSTLVPLAFVAPDTLAGMRAVAFAPALFIVFLQAALWSAAAVAISAMCTRPFVAASVSTFVLVVLPRGLWLAAALWSPIGRTDFGEMPFDAQVEDFTQGVFSLGVTCIYAALTTLSLFIASKCIALTRFVSRETRGGRFSTVLTILLAATFSIAFSMLCIRLDIVLDLPIGARLTFSPRMHHILSESSGRIVVTAFLPRRDPAFRPVAHFLRTLKHQAEATGGLEIGISFVDPQWDLGVAGRLIRRGAKERSLVFEKGPRVVVLPLDDGYGDNEVASAIRRVAMPPQRRDVYWTSGHGETSYETYGAWGMSDIARELSRDGYRNRTLDLSSDSPIPSDCAFIVVAGAKDGFSRAELNRVDAYLKNGGRLLVLTGSSGDNGVSSLLPTWGIRPRTASLVGARTLSGTDVIVSDFAEHAITAGFDGARLVLERPLAFETSGAAENGAGADRLVVTPIARVGSAAMAVAVERGATAGDDLAIRPTRIVAVGDPSFVMNGPLSARSNANRNFFMNVVSYLSGTEATRTGVAETGLLVTGLDRAARGQFALLVAVVSPLGVFLVLALVLIHRRRRG